MSYGGESGQARGAETQETILLVVGAHPSAERTDRFTAYALRERAAPMLAPGHDLLVVTDVWVLNHDELRARPTISVGPPSVNAMSAYLADKLPTALASDGRYVVQLDGTYDDLVCALWGEDPEQTAAAAEAFSQRYLAEFLQACARETV